MHITRNLSLPRWDDQMAEAAAAYWRGRGYTVSVEDGPSLTGSRGSGLGALFPFFFGRDGAGFFDIDWRKLQAAMTMTPQGSSDVVVDIDVFTFLDLNPRNTEWGPAYLRLEIAELHHVLCGAGDLASVWHRFTEAERRASSLWIWTKGWAGRRVSEEWEDEIGDLEVRFLLTEDGST